MNKYKLKAADTTFLTLRRSAFAARVAAWTATGIPPWKFTITSVEPVLVGLWGMR